MSDSEEELFGSALSSAYSEAEGQEDDETPFELLAEEAEREGAVPYGKGKNLKALRAVRLEILEGEITVDEYEEVVEKILISISRAVDLMEMGALKKNEATLPELEATVVAQTREEMKRLKAGVESMLQYGQSGLLGDLDDGMRAVEEAMQNLTKLRDSADHMLATREEAEA